MRRIPDQSSTVTLTILAFVFILAYTHGIPNYEGLPPGPYCEGRYERLRCCGGRQDECSAPILTTLCYCDDFCNRTREEDCCPDYWSYCRGINIDPPSQLKTCHWKGRRYTDFDVIEDNCNKCKCTDMGTRTEVLCEKNRCLVEPSLLDAVNIQSSYLGWRAQNHSEFWGKTLESGIKLRLGTLNPSKSVYNMNPVRGMYDPSALPREFNAITKWPHDIVGIRDQGWCGASWAVSTVDVASDRFAIMSKGAESVVLAAQHLVSCNSRGQQGCNGGYLDKAWQFMRRNGLVDEDCYPWAEKAGKCKVRRGSTLRSAGCQVPQNSRRSGMYKVGPAYRLGNETDIMQEIMISGPVQATMKVYQDFFIYKSGVYKHSEAAKEHRTGYHSVRIIGWGEEPSVYGSTLKYWLVANTWGTDWGENGYFRILRGSNECEIESYVLAAWAKPMHSKTANSV